jgi:hypothetical protein
MVIVAKNIIVGGENKSTPKPIEKQVKPVEVVTFKEATIVREPPVVTSNDHYHIVIDNDLEKRYHKRSAYQSDMIDL